ncbi:MAG: hypothetical protein ACE5FL_03895 [Myxococcota bacterium]
MHRMIRMASLAVVSLALVAPAASADTVLEGATDGGALVKIQVPDVWNGSLVIYNHGFDLGALVPSTPDLGPLAPLMLSEGYAVGASSYRQNGWALYKTKQDLRNLVQVFTANFGEPAEILVHGFSLGGIVTAQAIEKGELGNVVGAYPACGALAGSRSWDGAIDLRLVYDAICAGVPGAAIPGGGTGLPARFTEFPFTNTDFGAALQSCFGLFAPPPFRTPDQVARLSLFLDETDLPENFIATDMGFAVFALSDLIFDPAKLKGGQGMGNIGVVYENAAIDASIERVAAEKKAAKRHKKNFTPKGKVHGVKIVSIHTDGDGLVIVEQEQTYQDVVKPGNLTVAVVNEAGNTHCGFGAGELTAGWESLRSWVAGGPQPTVASIQGTCQFIDPTPGACRYDPTFVIPNMDDRVPPRADGDDDDDDGDHD